jgi:hypothetical protein
MRLDIVHMEICSNGKIEVIGSGRDALLSIGESVIDADSPEAIRALRDAVSLWYESVAGLVPLSGGDSPQTRRLAR